MFTEPPPERDTTDDARLVALTCLAILLTGALAYRGALERTITYRHIRPTDAVPVILAAIPYVFVIVRLVRQADPWALAVASGQSLLVLILGIPFSGLLIFNAGFGNDSGMGIYYPVAIGLHLPLLWFVRKARQEPMPTSAFMASDYGLALPFVWAFVLYLVSRS